MVVVISTVVLISTVVVILVVFLGWQWALAVDGRWRWAVAVVGAGVSLSVNSWYGTMVLLFVAVGIGSRH